MAILENSLLKLFAAKTSIVVMPLGLIGIAAIWVSKARSDRAPSPLGDDSRARREAADTAQSGERPAYRPSSVSTLRGQSDREALLSQILEENIRLREALK